MIFAAIPIAIGLVLGYTHHYVSTIVTGVVMVLLGVGTQATAIQQYTNAYGRAPDAGMVPAAVLLVVAGIAFIAWGAVRERQRSVSQQVTTPSGQAVAAAQGSSDLSRLRSSGYRWKPDASEEPTPKPRPKHKVTKTTQAGRAYADGYRWTAGVEPKPARSAPPPPRSTAATRPSPAELSEKRRQRDTLLALVEQLDRELAEADRR